MIEHYSVALVVPDDEGWFHARCNCGWDFGAVLPSAEDACDSLMDHAFEAGYRELQASVLPPASPQEER